MPNRCYELTDQERELIGRALYREISDIEDDAYRRRMEGQRVTSAFDHYLLTHLRLRMLGAAQPANHLLGNGVDAQSLRTEEQECAR